MQYGPWFMLIYSGSNAKYLSISWPKGTGWSGWTWSPDTSASVIVKLKEGEVTTWTSGEVAPIPALLRKVKRYLGAYSFFCSFIYCNCVSIRDKYQRSENMMIYASNISFSHTSNLPCVCKDDSVTDTSQNMYIVWGGKAPFASARRYTFAPCDKQTKQTCFLSSFLKNSWQLDSKN